MNEQAICHIPDSKYCYAYNKDTVELRLRVDKNDQFLKVSVIYGGKYDYQTKRFSADLKLIRTDRLYSYYSIRIKLEDLRLVYVFELIDKNEKSYFFSEDGLSENYDYTLNYYNAFQLPYINEIDCHRPVEWMNEAIFYQIFVDRFNKGDTGKNLDYINLDWGEIPNPKSFAGGDIKGIIEKLDYISDLGANAIYITPIFKSKSNHKYDISDYYLIDEQFGSNEDLQKLVEIAHKKGIRIILDAVFNHCSNELFQFKDCIEKGNKSKYFNWFIINDDYLDTDNVNYECFANCDYMPKFNTSNPEVQKFLIEIATHYVQKYNIDGWRLDVGDEVSHDFWRNFRKTVKNVNQDCVIIGENWHNAYPFLTGNQYDSIMNYAFTKATLDFFAFGTSNVKAYSEKLNELLMRNTDIVNYMMLNLLDSHDTHRFYTRVEKSKTKLLAAIAVMIFYIGTPCLYYGTEIPLEGEYDPDCRRTMDWNKAYEKNDFNFEFRKLLKLRENSKALKYGSAMIRYEKYYLIIEREYDNETLQLIVDSKSFEYQINTL